MTLHMERGGFEPPIPGLAGITAFEAAAFNHSAISPHDEHSFCSSESKYTNSVDYLVIFKSFFGFSGILFPSQLR